MGNFFSLISSDTNMTGSSSVVGALKDIFEPTIIYASLLKTFINK
jgi:hypothetical protein